MQETNSSHIHSFIFINLASSKEVLELKRKKNLIGTFEGCDVILKDHSISHYHALAIVEKDGILLIDLQSTNGVYINGKRVEKGMVYSGDTFSLGNKIFRLEENAALNISDEDALVKKKIDIPPTMPTNFKDTPKNLILVDDEYCDITFDDQKITHLGKLSYEIDTDTLKNYIDPDETDDRSKENLLENLKFKIHHNKSVEITVSANGTVISTHYFQNTCKKIKVSPKKESKNSFIIPTLTEEKILIEKNNQVFHLNRLANFSLQKNSVLLNEEIAMPLTDGDLFILTHGLIQIFIRIVETPLELTPVSFFTKDKVFFKESLRILLVALVLMIPTFFVKKPILLPPEREIAVIYKHAPPPPPPQEKIAKSAQGESMPTEEKSGGQQGGASQVKVTATKAPSSAPERAPAPPLRAYKFATSGKLGSLFKSSTNIGTLAFSTAGRGPSSVDTGLAVGKAGDGAIKLGSGGTGRLGSGGPGNGTGIGAGPGSGGVYSKNGIDTATIDSRTVILGSIDPELLRKILREYLPQFRHCYQQELSTNSEDLKGIVDLNFRIEGDGKVSSIDINSRDSRFSKKGTGCMASVLRMIDFPKPKGGGLVDVRQPLNFFAEKEKIN